MPQPKIYYRERLTLFLKKKKAVKAQLVRISLLRLLVFLTAAVLLYTFHREASEIVLIALPGTALFLYLVNRTLKIRYLKNKYEQLIRINQTEIDVLGGSLHHLDTGEEYKNREHAYSQDIDLFGKGSFFQYSNRTVTTMGKDHFAGELASNHIDQITAKQEMVRELSPMADWRQEFMANALIIKTDTPEQAILKWLKNFQPTLPSRLQWLPFTWSLMSLTLLLLTIFNYTPLQLFIYWFISGLVVSGIFFSRISKLSLFISKAQDTFRQYQKLLEAIEDQPFTSELLQKRKNEFLKGSGYPSAKLKRLARMIDALDQRNNLLIAILINPLGLADLYNGLRIQNWILQYREEIPEWFELIAFFDAAITKANFLYNHPEYCFPQIRKKGGVISTSGLGHPLIPEEKLIRNNITTDAEEFMVITGANMAGKSTFLRTTALFIVMANCGLPVCAVSASYRPIKLITSMRTTDSLNEEASYFYAELKRLKFIVDALKDQEYFIILDEILKGTNSTDKAIGSRKFVERLASTGSSGIIATHDLSLCEVASEIKSVKNYFFDAYIENDELRFDYLLREGVCTNMNASFLLTHMGIVQ